ncbi:UDP-Glycosyltransferase/glycogen phosphorylase [Exidia glandulosa HHB12029]|uniref:UDP-Glycosyltransferase/glycogen phosphorylase n=1 Tax=Exidia glandulosa HHB12029 TaxID=1314781 RepID=A0A166BSM5_EXIGL|nr:UDP-Glycosyltransferase/glycogen phosphorylase [Exidia glandulosa HHB12029]
MASIPASTMRQHPRKKLRIAIVTENLMPKVDGVTRTLARLLTHLREQGHECVVLGPESGMGYYETFPLIGTLGIPLVLYPGLKLNFLRPKFLRTIVEFNPDVIHVVDPVWLGAQFLFALEAGWCGPEWQGPRRRPVVASYHTNLPTYATLFGMAWLEPIMWSLLRCLHKKCVLTACPSASTAEALRTGHKFQNLRIWPRGVDLSIFTPAKRSSKIRERLGAHLLDESPVVDWQRHTLGDAILRPPLSPPRQYRSSPSLMFPLTPPPSPTLNPLEDDVVVILYVGRISYEKNLQLLIDAFAHLVKSLPGPSVRLALVGDGPHRGALEMSVAAHGLSHLTTFAGQISNPSELAAWYASADVFAFPSYTETFGQVVCEALASGLPVVGLDAEGTRDLVSHGRNGLLLPRGKGEGPEAYAALLAEMVRDGKRRKEMGWAAVQSAQGRTWAGAMERMVDCYREAIECAARPNPRWSGLSVSQLLMSHPRVILLLVSCLTLAFLFLRHQQ